MQFIFRKGGCTCTTSTKMGMQKKKLVMLTAHGQHYFQLQSDACNLCWCILLLLSAMISIVIIILYIYHALISALSAHRIHINLNMIFYTHVEYILPKQFAISIIRKNKQTHTHTRTRTRTHTQAHAHAHTHARTHSDCSRNWVLILVGMKIL